MVATLQPLAMRGGMTALKEGYITIKEASDRTGYNAEYLRRLIRLNKIRAEKLGTVYLVNVASLDDYLATIKDADDDRTGPRKQ